MEIKTIKEINNLVREYEKNIASSDFDINAPVNLIGWVRSNRCSGKILFISFSDGSRLNSIQLVLKSDELEGSFEEIKNARTGAAIIVSGNIVINKNDDEGQRFEILVKKAKLLKQSSEDYPIQKKEHSMEFLREVAHVRPRTNKFYSIMNVRSELSFAIHNFFHLNGFKWVSSPIITANDAEGAGEAFNVTTSEGENAFFNRKASLTVSGQLHAEAYAQAFKRVYTFGPTFRAEKSHTNKHLAEFWMVEPEVAFCDLEKLMILIESFVKFTIKTILKRCSEEIAFFKKLEGNENIDEKLSFVIESNFQKLTYSQAISILKEAIGNGKANFEDNNIFFGMDLKTEHERYICEQHVNGPVFIYNYPKEIKSFYMKLNDDGTTVAACDLLVPGIGELVGGSERENDYYKIENRAKELNIPLDDIQWYLDLRKYGYNKSAGFGLGFERLVMYICGVENIRDTIPFPRFNGNLKF